MAKTIKTESAEQKREFESVRRAMDMCFNLAWLQVALRERQIKALEIKLCDDAETWTVKVNDGPAARGPNLGDILQIAVETIASEQGL